LSFVPERSLADPEQARGLCLVVVRGDERAQDELPLELVDGRLEGEPFGHHVARRFRFPSRGAL